MNNRKKGKIWDVKFYVFLDNLCESYTLCVNFCEGLDALHIVERPLEESDEWPKAIRIDDPHENL